MSSPERAGGTDRGCRALALTPLVAALAWYLTSLLRILVADGHLDPGADVATLGIGALLFGVPLAAAVTVTLAAPLYRILEQQGRLTLATVLLGGAALGLAVALAFLWVEGSSVTLPTGQGIVVGLLTATVWWWIAGRARAE